jgi:hypothetical protein
LRRKCRFTRSISLRATHWETPAAHSSCMPRDTRVSLRLFPATLPPDGALPYGWIGFLELPKLRPHFRLKSFRVLPARRSAMPLSQSFILKVERHGVVSSSPKPYSPLPLGQPINAFASKRLDGVYINVEAARCDIIFGAGYDAGSAST